MSDIFISYSRKDSEQALALAERLRSEGMSVWIDQQGIEAAKSWSEEIVNAIEQSKAFLLLLSARSIESEHVARELSLAFESQRVLLPVAIEDVTLPAKFKYPLAGIQRVAYTQFASIASALIGCGVSVAQPTTVKRDDRKSIVVMPFQDLSPTQDNLWFADGLAGELIDRLSHIKSLRIVDRKTALGLRNTTLGMYEIAKTLDVRYAIEGSIRKFGDQIKISTALIDVAEGEHLWQESRKGVMTDVFELQESVAQQVFDALHVSLRVSESSIPAYASTKNAHAYELYLRASNHYDKLTLDSMELAVSLFRDAVALDPTFVAALNNLIIGLLELHRLKGASGQYLDEARSYTDQIRQLQGESFEWCWASSSLALRIKDIASAEALARRAVTLDPERAGGHDILAIVLKAKGDHQGAADSMLQHARLKKTLHSHEKLLFYLSEAGDQVALRKWALVARPMFEQHLKLHPDDIHMASTYCSILHWTGDSLAAGKQVERMLAYPLSGHALYNLSCLLCDLNQRERSVEVLEKAILAGYNDLDSIAADPDLSQLKDHPSFRDLIATSRIRQSSSG